MLPLIYNLALSGFYRQTRQYVLYTDFVVGANLVALCTGDTEIQTTSRRIIGGSEFDGRLTEPSSYIYLISLFTTFKRVQNPNIGVFHAPGRPLPYSSYE